MKIKSLLLAFCLLLPACASATETPTLTPPPTVPPVTPTLAEPSITTIRPPDPAETAQAYFEAWQADDFAAMYALLSAGSRSLIAEEAFVEAYVDPLAMAAVPPGAIAFEVLEATIHSGGAQVGYRLTWQSVLFGDLVRENTMFLEWDGEGWRVAWNPGLILPELAGGNVLQRIYYLPGDRGNIYDRNGSVMVGPGDAYAIGIVPARINLELEGDMLGILGLATGLPPEFLITLYQNQGYQYDFYIAVADESADVVNRYYNGLASYDAIQINAFSARYYFRPGDASHLLGYTGFVSPEEQDAVTRQGYWWTSRIPRAGVELWGDQYLAGTQGGALVVNAPDGSQVELLSEKFPQPGGSLTLTVDQDLQSAAQQALFGMRGAVVVLERDTGRILALASSPTYSPNLFTPENTNSIFTSPFNDFEQPILNRAINGQYPLGSVFKIITMAAALETGVFAVEDTYDCQYEFTELVPNGPVLYDWTYERNLERLANEEDPFPPSGILTLPEGLMRSCNPWFYHIGLKLYDEGLTNAIPDMARGFGLGAPTGVVGLPNESIGQVPDPTEKLDATNLATGQGNLLVTPLQVAQFVAAVGNGGTLYVPQLVEQAKDAAGNIVYQFAPIAAGGLPASPETLAAIQQAMGLVVNNSRGTANQVFRNFGVALAGKTGTAQTALADPHAWFVAYSSEAREGLPDIAVVVVIENRGEGSEWAAPVARRVLEHYFFGRIIRGYPWEIRIGVPEWLIPDAPEEEGGDE
jgi:penicillin-binding protein 2